MIDPSSLLGSLRSTLRLSPSEDEMVFQNILARCSAPAPAFQADPCGLYAYEKALIFDSLVAYMEGNPAPASLVAIPAGHRAAALRPGRLLSALRPFTVR